MAAGPTSWIVRLDGADQSYVDLADPTRLAFDYVRRMGDVIDAHGSSGQPVRIVHVGGAGLTLPRYVAATRPRSPQIVLEPDVALTELVRRDLPLPARSGIKVRPVDGRAGLSALRTASTHLVVVDAFAGTVVPADLVTLGCFAEVARVLDESGWLLLNLVDKAPFGEARRVVAGIRAVFPAVLLSAEPATLRGRRPGNLLVVAATGSVPVAALRARAATGALPYRVLDGDAVSSSFGGGLPHSDP